MDMQPDLSADTINTSRNSFPRYFALSLSTPAGEPLLADEGSSYPSLPPFSYHRRKLSLSGCPLLFTRSLSAAAITKKPCLRSSALPAPVSAAIAGFWGYKKRAGMDSRSLFYFFDHLALFGSGYSTPNVSAVTFSMICGSRGLSRMSVSTAAISSTTSIPSMTLPNAAYCPSRCAAFSCIIKN